jgi:hypothetical protein
MLLAKLKELPRPIAIYAYFDLIQVWRREPLDDATYSWLAKQCSHLYFENKPARHDYRLRQRVEMKRLSESALRWLVAQEDAYLNRLEIALDLQFLHEEDRDEAFVFIHHHFIRNHRGHKQQIVLLRGHGNKSERVYDVNLAETRYDGRRGSRNLFVSYKEDKSRITGEVLPVLHLEWRVNGVRSLRRLGIHSVADLDTFDHNSFWANRLLLVDISPQRAGRLVRNRIEGTKSRTSSLDDRREGSILLKACGGSIQELLDQHGSHYPIRRILTRIPNDSWLPNSGQPSVIYQDTSTTHNTTTQIDHSLIEQSPNRIRVSIADQIFIAFDQCIERKLIEIAHPIHWKLENL